MWGTALVLSAVIAAAIAILWIGTRVRVDGSGIKMGLRTYTNEEIMRHRFSVEVSHKSPAEYASERNVHMPRPLSHKPKWCVELCVFDSGGQYLRTHLLQKPNKRTAEELAAELKRGLALRLK